jgi:parallel beta-helix repeat protein
MKKLLVVGVILLFLGSSIPVLAHSNESNLPLSRGNWLYVGGSGPGNYTKIQDAVNHASEGDTVYVYDDSSPYYEQVTINTTISLIGEDQESTIISGQSKGSTLLIRASSVKVKGFHIIHGTYGIETLANGLTLNNLSVENAYSGILLKNLNKSSIDSCFLSNCSEGITLKFASNNVIHNSVFKNCTTGMGLYSSSSDNTIYECTLSKCIDIKNAIGSGLLISSDNNLIFHNKINSSNTGIWIGVWNYAYRNSIKQNTIESCDIGIFLDSAKQNIITQNNLINSRINGYFSWSTLNCWLNNYWGQTMHHPKVIIGCLCPPFLDGTYIKITIPWINFDWIPAKQPFDIPTMN